MWFIKFLSGPHAGKTLPLKPGRNMVGRAPHCEVLVPSKSVSKEHATIEVYNDKIIITDLDSRNGTFINGIQIKSHRLQPGEKISFFDILVEIGKKPKPAQKATVTELPPPARPSDTPPLYGGNLAYDQNHDQNPMATPYPESPTSESAPQHTPPAQNLWAYFIKYLEEVVLPGVYKLPEWLEFRYVLGLFVAAFIVFVTALSTVPLMRILKYSIENESQNRAKTIARTLARENRNAIMQGQSSLVSTENADNEPGVTAYVISNLNGDVIAPARLAGQYLTDIPFVNEARKTGKEEVNQVSDDLIVAVAPIRFYNSSTGSDTIAAHAVVVYNMGSLAVDDNRTLSLFVQILFIAILLGGVLYYFLYKIIQFPVLSLNQQINTALRDGQTQIHVSYQYPELQQLATNINSAISRGSGGFAGNNLQVFEFDRSLEMQNIVNVIGFPALTVRPEDRVITAANEHFLTHIGQGGNWTHIEVDQVLDQALKLNILSLLEKINLNPSQMAQDQLEISNQNYEISAQSIYGSKNIAYVLIVFIPKAGDPV